MASSGLPARVPKDSEFCKFDVSKDADATHHAANVHVFLAELVIGKYALDISYAPRFFTGDALTWVVNLMRLHEGNDNRVMKNLIEKANDDPQGFIEAYEDEFKHIVILVRKAVDLGIVSRRGEIGIFYFNEHQLGVSFDDIVSELVKDEALLTLLNSEVAKR